LDDALASVAVTGHETPSRRRTPPVASHGEVRRLWVPTRKTPAEGRCSGHLRLV